ncbi:MAG: hypothetical protein L7S64_00340 [Longimicrobiales bacterium]|nr:hypothetical protein [Longimicrobiales bacterium]
MEDAIFSALKDAKGVQPDPTLLSPSQTKGLKSLGKRPGSSDVPAWAEKICEGAHKAYRNYGSFRMMAVSTASNLSLSLDVTGSTHIKSLHAFEVMLNALVEEGNHTTVVIDALREL